MERIIAPIDNKNIMEDWIYDDLYDDGCVEKSQSGKKRNVVGYYKGYVMETEWTLGDNFITFKFYGETPLDIIDNLIEYVRNFEDIETEFHRDSQEINCAFYFNVEE